MTNKNQTIPTGGNFRNNLARARKAFRRGGLEAKYLISGLGSDPERNWIKEPHDLTIQDYLLLQGVSPTNIGIDYESHSTEENLINCFPKGQEGTYEWNSYVLHNIKTKRVFKNLQKQDLASKTVTLKFNSVTPKISSFSDLINFGKNSIYGIGALIETYGIKIPFKEKLKNKLS
jgi:hypothetical protein